MAPAAPAPPADTPVGRLLDHDLLNKARRAKNGEDFSGLYDRGDTSKYNGDNSAADMALCNRLAFWTGRDAGRIDELFRQSALMRPKWDERHGAQPYGEMTIRKAIEECREVYEPLAHSQKRAESDSVEPGDYSDAGNAEVFERLYKLRTIWTRGGGWFVWDGKHWEQGDHRALALAREMSGRMLEEALDKQCEAQKRIAALNESLSSPETIDEDMAQLVKKEAAHAKSFLAHANATRRKTRLDAILGLAQAGLWSELSAFDPNPLDLNTPAGIVDLARGTIRPHSSGAMCSKMTTAAPGDAGRRMWDDFLRLVTDDDPSLTGFLQTVAGMSLIGRVYHEGIILAFGGGRNGKSTFFNALADTLGGYAGRIAVNTLTTERTNKGATLATLRGRRLILTGELEEHQRLSVSMLKALASTDKLVAEEKFRAPEEFKQSHTLCLFTNHLPRVGSTDNGTWRRLTVVPFEAVINGQSAIQNYGEVLVREAAPSILQWAIEGAANFTRNGCKLVLPERVAVATEEYRAREDWVSNFIAERCVNGDRVSGGELYAAYRAWAEETGEYVRRQSDFVSALEAAGYKKLKSHGINYWLGLRLDKAQTFAAQGFYHSG